MTPTPPILLPITITTYNTVSARGVICLQEVLWAMSDLNTDIAILTEAKLCKRAQHGSGYSVFALGAPSASQGGVALVWQLKLAHWTLESMQAISPNLVSAMLVLGTHWWLLLGTYLTPNEPPDTELNALKDKHHCNAHLLVILVGNLKLT